MQHILTFYFPVHCKLQLTLLGNLDNAHENRLLPDTTQDSEKGSDNTDVTVIIVTLCLRIRQFQPGISQLEPILSKCRTRPSELPMGLCELITTYQDNWSLL